VSVLRRGLDNVEELLGAIESNAKPRKPFDLNVAYELYASLLSPVEGLIRDKRHLIVVPSGPLTALPFHLLTTQKPALVRPGVNTEDEVLDLGSYKNAAWLLRRHALSVVPSVASLKALRALGRQDQATKPMIGFGDPIFGPEQPSQESEPAERRISFRPRGYAGYWRGSDIDRNALEKAQRLPDTADELKIVAAKFGVPSSEIYLRGDATETKVKQAVLENFRVIYFATHGLVAGDIKGLGEPSLLLTLPKEPSEIDDGLLTASEVSQLRMNAEWVVLSACNTVAGEKPGAEALSGLAKAFFYAGAKALLVSHWSVESSAAVKLTTAAFEELKVSPHIGRAEALRRSMLALMNDMSRPINAYPGIWAPFSIVGEGAAR
jgi:CHAT domain-containing protein